MKATAPESLLELMDVDLLVKKESGEFIILHDKPLPATVEYIEYDTFNHELYFILTDGQVFVLGAKIQDSLRPHLVNGRICVLIHTDTDGNMFDMGTVKLEVKKEN